MLLHFNFVVMITDFLSKEALEYPVILSLSIRPLRKYEGFTVHTDIFHLLLPLLM